jgi:hypothetical protein
MPAKYVSMNRGAGHGSISCKNDTMYRFAGLYANQVKPRGAAPLEKPLNPTLFTTN